MLKILKDGLVEEFLVQLIRHLVNQPDEVHINVESGEHTIVLELRAGNGDMGQVIGDGAAGHTAGSLRRLSAAAFGQAGQAVCIGNSGQLIRRRL